MSRNPRALPQLVFHGSPYRGIDKFSTEKIGTGEGAQAYGWGLYFAEQKDVAAWYMETLCTEEQYVKGVLLDCDVPEHMLAFAFDMEGPDLQDVGDYLRAMALPGGARSVRESAAGALVLLEAGSRPSVERIKLDGQLYEVEIPSDAQMLFWDKPLSEQSVGVQNMIEALDWLDPSVFAEFTGQQCYEGMVRDAMMFEAMDRTGARRSVSLSLAGAGIKGIKYLDGDSRHAGGGSFNYVIFDGADAQISDVFYSRAVGKMRRSLSPRGP